MLNVKETLTSVNGKIIIPGFSEEIGIPTEAPQNEKPVKVGNKHVLISCTAPDQEEVAEYLFSRINKSPSYKNKYKNIDWRAYKFQVQKILTKMEKLNYLRLYRICLEEGNEPIEVCLVQNDFPSNKLIMEQINLILNSTQEELEQKKYILTDQEGKQYLSATPGEKGGHHKLGIYGRMDCPSARKYIAQGNYVQERVFFANEETAIRAGYRPCGICSKEAYKKWKEKHETLR